MRISVIISLTVAVLSASLIPAHPFPHLASSAFDPDGRPLRALPHTRLAGPLAQAHPRIPDEYDVQEAVGQAAYDSPHMRRHEARELAKLVLRAMYQSSEGLHSREYEELERRSMTKADKKKIGDVLDQMEDRDVSFTWDVKWSKAHNANTSQLDGYKPGSRIDSTEPHAYHVGLFKVKNKQIVGDPVIQVSFPTEPESIGIVVAALRQALDAA